VSPGGAGPQETNESSSKRASRRAIFEQEYDGRTVNQEGQPVSDDPDLTLDVPSLEVEELNLDVENLRARISLQAELADMVKLNVGLEADVDKVKLEAKGVEAQVLLKAGLDNVRVILSQALDALDNNPQILEDLLRTSENTAGGERALEGAATTVEDPPQQGADEDVEGSETERGSAAEPYATAAARRKAEELGLDLSRVEGTGSGGRILLRDVKKAAK
jgi:pyruvate/2-oxoglutarate dehydrogenase complex dihydrolipoamide acyltransferase (E2) component